ncbi:MAG TPA: protein-glutamate O-methyltransferase CheR [Persephonella sp.]|uniref:protein-glutamate O-methyltransferase n=1 Tax=Persephonella marina (strain DSM 14350 / EX-H1) TaxID=123214 RepID=C0QPU1_PERMH|nr:MULTISPECIES: protein-glutamate O-methyltransferase CheR [Persephonella]ACO04452.1 chemotaxis protein methyltransferase 2 [Persephonella marina EX-H1]HCB69698.1 protein-glutamate O-methyltransferase CheR [Persephonella sp.]
MTNLIDRVSFNDCFDRILDLFYMETGIVFKTKRDIAKRKIDTFLRKQGFRDCSSFLKALEDSDNLMQKLIDFLTVNETYFFREKHHFEIIYDLLKDKKKPVRILSIPSSSGEEVYSLLIFLLEKGVDPSNFEIVGADINREAVEKAKKGVFSFRSMMNVDESVLDRYFERVDGNVYRIKDIYKRYVSFLNINLFSDRIFTLGKFDFILCRNLFIYFSEEYKQKAMDIFYKLLKDDGVLILGHADTVREFKNFKREFNKGSYIYKKLEREEDVG